MARGQGGTADVRLHVRRYTRLRGCAVVALALAASAFAPFARAEPPSTAEARAFIEKLWPVAQARGISRPLFERATDTFIPDPEVIELAAFQPALDGWTRASANPSGAG